LYIEEEEVKRIKRIDFFHSMRYIYIQVISTSL